MKLNNWKIGTRIAAMASVLLAFFVLLGAFTLHALTQDAERLGATQDQARQFQQAVDLARSAQVTFKIQVQEWKNFLLRGGDPAAYDKYKQGFAKEGEAMRAKLGELKTLLVQMNLPTAKVDEALQSHDTLQVKYNAAMAHYDVTKADASAHLLDGMVKGIDRAPTAQIDTIVVDVLKAAASRHEQADAETQANLNRARWLLSIVMIAAVGAGVLCSWVILRSITMPLSHAVDVVADLAGGNLTARINVDGHDETSQVMAAMSRMNQNLHQVVSQVRTASQVVAHASSEIASGNLDLSNRTEQQASSLQETASAIEHLTRSVQLSAGNAHEANELAAQACSVAEQGGAVVGNVVATMTDINDSSRKIADIIGVIDGIAFQTNILALNAAVEAARAGEQGRGFAVVASEVRALAQRSANAAKEIKTLINASVECVDRGSSLVNDAGSTIASAVDAVKQVRDVIAKIAAAVEEQSSGISQVSQSVSSIDQAMQQNAALVEESAAAAASLKHQAETLVHSVEFFKS
ncbi:MAG: HAMP domain-containing protein [Burkholderiales bacterium]|nr:HAMP domain-containing protein [Burkholderiales bacterium]